MCTSVDAGSVKLCVHHERGRLKVGIRCTKKDKQTSRVCIQWEEWMDGRFIPFSRRLGGTAVTL